MDQWRPHKVMARVAAAAVVVLAMAIQPAEAARQRSAYPPLVIWDYSGPYVQNFNPFGPEPYALSAYAHSLVYEPLYIVDDAQFKQHPWLATSYGWSKDLKTLTFVIRKGVRWSDGQPMTARDVYYTLAILPKTCPTCDQAGVLAKPAVRVTMQGDTVSLRFPTVDTTRLQAVGDVVTVPEHIWSKVKNPAPWADPNPVGTGPYTQIRNFSSASFDGYKNPYYWRKANMPPAVRIVGFTSADSGNLAVEAGQVDWAYSLLPKVQQVFVARNPGYFHYFLSTVQPPNFVYVNDSKYPFSIPALRQALSMAIDRSIISRNADFGYFPPSDPTGMAHLFPQWVPASMHKYDYLTQYNPARARAVLGKAGFTWKNGQLIDPRGKPVSFPVLCSSAPGATSPGVAECNIFIPEWKAIGVNATMQVATFNTLNDALDKGTFDAIDAWPCAFGDSPWRYFYFLTYGWTKLGTFPPTCANYARWHDAAWAKMQTLIAQSQQTTDKATLRHLTDQMEQLWIDNMPAIPLTIDAVLALYNTKNYTGFPTAADNYAYPWPFGFDRDTALILSRVHPTR